MASYQSFQIIMNRITYISLTLLSLLATTACSNTSTSILTTLEHSKADYVNFADADIPPKPIFIQQAAYPKDYREAHIEGFATTDFVVNTSGIPVEITTVSATNKVFSHAAIEAMKHWRFSVAKKNGLAVMCRMQIVIKFVLSD